MTTKTIRWLLFATAALAVLTLFVWLRRAVAAVRVAAFGLVLLISFIVVRAASFHHMDEWVTYDIAGVRTGWWLEIAGILTIGLSALAYSRRNRSRAD